MSQPRHAIVPLLVILIAILAYIGLSRISTNEPISQFQTPGLDKPLAVAQGGTGTTGNGYIPSYYDQSIPFSAPPPMMPLMMP